MAVKLTRKTAVLAKIEGTYGTDPTPTGSANAILIKNLTITPMAATLVARDNLKPYLGETAQLVADNHYEVEFEVEMAGSGTLGTAPAYGPLLRACGHTETVNDSTSVVYTPLSDTFESVTIYVNIDGINHKFTGARGTVDFGIVAKAIPTYKFKFWGIYNAATDTDLPSTTLTGFEDPLVANNTNTGSFSFFSITTFVLESLTITGGNSVDFRALIGSESVEIMDRKASGTLSIEATPLATFDPFAAALAQTSGALSITHGTADGNTVKLDAPNVTLGNPTYADSNGVRMFSIPFFLLPDSGNDEYSVTIV